MLQKIKYYLVLLLMVLLNHSSYCQDSTLKVLTTPRYIEIGFGGNAYRGDLQAGYEKWSSGVHMGWQGNKKKRLNGAVQIQIGAINGQNPDYQFETNKNATPNVYFKTSIFTAHYEVQLNIIKRKQFKFYIAQGIGLIRFNPKDDQKNKLQDNTTTRAAGETYSNLAAMFPTSIGIQYFLPNHIGIGLKAGWINPNTDYLDNISQWGNKSGNDKILYFKFSILTPLVFKSEKQ